MVHVCKNFIGCFAFGGLGTLAGLSEIWTITCITYERYRAISTPLTKARRLSSLHVISKLPNSTKKLRIFKIQISKLIYKLS